MVRSEFILPSWGAREQSRNYSLVLQNWAYSFFGRRSGEDETDIIWRLKRLDFIAEHIAILLQQRPVFEKAKDKANKNYATRCAHKALLEFGVKSVLLDTFGNWEESDGDSAPRVRATITYQKQVAEHLLAFAKRKLESNTEDEQVAQLRDLLLDAAFWPFHTEQNVDVLIGWYKKRGMIPLGLLEKGDLDAMLPDEQSAAGTTEHTARSGSVGGEVNFPSPPPSQAETGRSALPPSVSYQLSHVSEHAKLLALLQAAMDGQAYEAYIARHGSTATLATVPALEEAPKALDDADTTHTEVTKSAAASTESAASTARRIAAEALLKLWPSIGTTAASDSNTFRTGTQSHPDSSK
jgi:hypothetical protein